MNTINFTRRRFIQASAGIGLAVAGLPAGPAWAAETTWQRIQREKTVRVGLSNESPFSSLKPDGSIGGEAPEVVKATLEPYGITKFDGVLTEFGSLIPGLLAKRFDVIAGGMAIRPARCEQIAFGNPEFRNGEALAVKKGNPKNLHSYPDVAKNPDAVFGTLQGGAQVEYAQVASIPQDRVLLFPDVQSAVSALQTGRVDAVGLPPGTLNDLFKKLNDPNVTLADPFTQPLNKQGATVVAYGAIGFRKEDSDFREAYNKQLAALEQSGKLLTILQSAAGWGESELPPPGLTAEQICKG